MLIKDLFDRQQESSLGLSSFNLSGVITKNFDPKVTEKVIPILNRYKNINI